MPGYLSANKETLGISGMPLIQPGFSVLCISDLENNWSREDWKGTVGFFPQISASPWTPLHGCNTQNLLL